MNKPQQMKAKLADKQVFNDKFTQYKFELVQPHQMEFDAGQYVSIVVDEHGDRRSYSITSTPENKHSFELLIDHSPQGVGTEFLRNLEFGAQVDVMGPLGKFVLEPNGTEEELVFVATGSGIAPFRAMILDLLQDNNETRPITLYWGLRYVESMFWENEFQDLAEKFPNFKFHPVISRAMNEWPLCRGRVTDCLSIHETPINAAYYLCGGEAMITEVNAMLQQKGIETKNIHFEKFF